MEEATGALFSTSTDSKQGLQLLYFPIAFYIVYIIQPCLTNNMTETYPASIILHWPQPTKFDE